MIDVEVKEIFAINGDEFIDRINGVLSEKCWRIASTDISVSDSFWHAVLIKSIYRNSAEANPSLANEARPVELG